MTIQRPSADELIQARLAVSRKIAQLPEGSISPEGFAWSQSYNMDVTTLLARLSAAEQERDELRGEVNSYETPLPYKVGYEDGRQAAEARAEAADWLITCLEDFIARKPVRGLDEARHAYRAALAGREEVSERGVDAGHDTRSDTTSRAEVAAGTTVVSNPAGGSPDSALADFPPLSELAAQVRAGFLNNPRAGRITVECAEQALAALEQERDEAVHAYEALDGVREQLAREMDAHAAAEARAEVLEEALREIADSVAFNSVDMRILARAALAGREETT